MLADGSPVVAWYDPEGIAPSEVAPVNVAVERTTASGKRYEWLAEPTIEPAWAAGVFGANPDHGTWAALY